jgi:putative addiction module CopG family antidote
MLAQPLPPELGQFVKQQIAAGRYGSEEELMVDAVRVLREVNARQQQFRADVQLGIDQFDRGEANAYGVAQLRERFEQLKNQVRQRIADDKGPQ